MLETEEVDDDYFTPVASASLANIFGKANVTEERSDNESLKYTPAKSQTVNQQPEDSKATSCIFACALVGYEWHNNVYSQKGKLGFAILKILKTGSHNIVLYDSNKTTLSNATISSKLKVTLKSNNYISYYDDQTKYWSLYGAENEIEKIIELLKTLDANIYTTTETDINPPEPTKPEDKTKTPHKDISKPIESDTDSSINKKTKASILNRMANMGHSVLPPNIISAEKNSDSSDTNDTDHQIKAVRHKPTKGVIKRNSTERTTMEHHKIPDMHTNVESSRMSVNSFISDQLVPMHTSAIVTMPGGSDMNLYITEQRINNSELRINIGRMSDKVDNILDKINNLQYKDQNEGSANVNTEILHKLLREYENKIKVYEELFQKMGTDVSTSNLTSQNNISKESLINQNVKELENALEQKDKAISELQSEVLKKSYDNEGLLKKISELEEEVELNKHLLKELSKANENVSKTNSNSDIESKIKSLMNETYNAVASNFEENETYSADSIKKVIALVIKKVTISALSE